MATPTTMMMNFFNFGCLMKKTFRLFAFAAAAVAMLSSCAKEAVVSNEEDTGKTFTVTAEYTEPNTDSKTAFVDDDNPYIKWQSTDQIRVYEFIDGEQNAYFKTAEDGTHLSADSKKATFDVVLHGDDKEGATSYCYTAIYPATGVQKSNSFYYFEIPASQTLSEGGNFAEESDVLIGKPVTMTSRISETENLEVQFKRPGTIVALTLKGITAGEAISSVKITAPEGQKIAGRCKVNLQTGEVPEADKAYYGGTNEITLNCSITATGDDKFYFRCLDGTWASGSEVSIAVETDAATYSKTVNLSKDYVFADGGLTRFGFQGMTRESKDSGTKYTLATSASDLYDGASYIFVGVNGSEYFAMGQQNDNNRNAESISAPVNSVITLPSTTSAYTFQLEAVTGGWAIKDITSGSAQNGKYLYAASSGSNLLKSQEEVDKNAIWTISIEDNKASIKADQSTNRKVMQYNSSSKLFSCYSSASQKPVYLYVDKSTCKEKVATPALAEGSAPAGEVNVGTVIKLTCATEGATIHYTTDGTKPTDASATYTDAGITINDDCTIKAIAVKEDCTNSDVLTLEYTVKVVADPEISISGTGLATVTCGTEGASIYYTVGTEPADPTSESTLYKEAVQLADGQTIKARAYKDGMKPSAVADATFVSGSYDVTFTHEQEHGTVTVNDDETGAVKVEEGADVTIKATPAANYHFVSWTITPDVSFTSGSATDATATFTMPASAVEVVAVFEKNPATAPVVTYDFSKISFEGWTSGYAQHVVEYDNATVTFTNASKQTGTITDIPVTKGSDITVVMKEGNVINSLTLLTKQWNTNANKVTLHTSIDGGKNYTQTSYTADAGATLSANNLKDVNAVKFTFSANNKQIGIAALSINGADLPKADASWSVSPESVSVKVNADETATITTNYDGTLSVSSNNTSIATATISGKTITVRGVAKGSTTLTVTGPATDVYNAIDKTINVTVTSAGVTILDMTTKTVGCSAYNTTTTYGDWKIVNGANNSKGWEYFKMGGKSATISSSNPCYIYNTVEISHSVKKITVHLPEGSLSVKGMSVNSWGVYVYSDSKMTTQVDYVAGGTITNSEGSFDFTPSAGKTWNAKYYYKISWNLANTTTTNGIICVDKITLSEDN